MTMVDRTLGSLAICAALAGCGARREPGPPREEPAAPLAAAPAAPADAAEASQEERLAAIQKAMNELDEAAQQCWAVAATERFDIEGEVTLQIDIAAGRAQASVVHDTARNAKLSACLVQLMAGYRWAPPLYGQAIQLPFKFRAPDGQSTIDRALVAWHGQGKVSVAVLLDENNSGNDAASMFELAIAGGGTTGLRRADRAELWYFAAAGEVRWPGGSRAVAAGDMMYVPRGAVRELAAAADLHAMVAVVPGGREGAARGGALPTPEAAATSPGDGSASHTRPLVILPASAARRAGSALIFGDAAAIPDRMLSAAIVTVAAGEALPEHVHAGETELWYVLAGAGTLTVNGVVLPVTATSVVQIPKNTKHAFTATSELRAVQLFTPAGPSVPAGPESRKSRP
jgi:quercetin dioxygenase-like cupin family protein